MVTQGVVDSDHYWEGLQDGGTEEILPALEPEDLEYLRGRGVLPLLGYEPAAGAAPAPAPAGAFGMVDVRAVLDGAFGVGGWEIRIGDGKSGGVIDTPPVDFPAGGAAVAPPPGAPGPRPQDDGPGGRVPPHARAEQRAGGSGGGRGRGRRAAGAAGDDGRVVCQRCGKGRHDPKYTQCFTCKRRDEGEDVDALVICEVCGEREHLAMYDTCWSCKDEC